MRVLVFTPYGPRLEHETAVAALGQSWPGEISHLFMCENPHGRNVGADSRRNYRQRKQHENILRQYQRGRKLFIDGGYDALFVIEADIIPPVDALEKLNALDADWATGAYMFRHGKPTINVYERYKGLHPRNTGEPISVRPAAYREALRQMQIDCSGGGLGCCLIRRHVLEQIDFRLGGSGDCDHYFTKDVYKAGFSMRADLSVICGHKKPDGEVLYPDYAQSRV